MDKKPFSKALLILDDPAAECERIATHLRHDVSVRLHRNGAVVGISGGIDSSVTLALAVKAFGNKKVLGLILPEKDSSADSALLATELAEKFGVETMTENITGALEGFGCYTRRDEAVRSVFPEYRPELHKMKIWVKDSGLFSNLPPLFHVSIIDSHGVEQSGRLPAGAMRQIIAASNFKQRCRMSMLYYHAERLHYAVIGTPNKHEVNQGFFVKHGDGAADVMPIGHLYKTQVYQIAEYLGIPVEIIQRTPTTDTYTAEQTQEEFFYQLPFRLMDQIWYAFENGYSPEEAASEVQLSVAELHSVFTNFERKIHTTEYLRMSPIRDY
jgi:NAD+ synthase